MTTKNQSKNQSKKQRSTVKIDKTTKSSPLEKAPTARGRKDLTIKDSKIGVTIVLKHDDLYALGFKETHTTTFAATTIREVLKSRKFRDELKEVI